MGAANATRPTSTTTRASATQHVDGALRQYSLSSSRPRVRQSCNKCRPSEQRRAPHQRRYLRQLHWEAAFLFLVLLPLNPASVRPWVTRWEMLTTASADTPTEQRTTKHSVISMPGCSWWRTSSPRGMSRGNSMLQRRKGRPEGVRSVNMLTAEDTFAVPAFWTLVEAHRGMYQFVGVEEHHLDKTRATDALRKASLLGLQRLRTPARCTGKEGTAGGTAFLCDEGQIVTALDAVPGQACVLPAELPFENLAPVIFRCGPVAAALMTEGDVLGGRNATRYVELAATARQMNIPGPIAGDCNANPGVFAWSAWLRYVGRVVETPQVSAHSGTAGQGNWIVFAVMRLALASLVHIFDMGLDGPWQPHAGMHLFVRAQAAKIPVSRLKASFLPELPALPRDERRTLRRLDSQCPEFSREVTAACPRHTWRKTWCSDPAIVPAAYAALKHLRGEASVDDAVRSTSCDKAVISATYSSDRTAHGADAMGPRALQPLPPEAVQELPTLLADCRRQRAWPRQLLLNTMAIPGKPSGDCRTVGLSQVLTRQGTCALRSATRRWCTAHAIHCDHARTGCSALRCTLINAPRIAFAVAQDQLETCALWDVITHYDTVGIAVLCREARHQHYPPTLLALAILQCTAVRVLKAGCTYSDELLPCSGMVAHVYEATTLARAPLIGSAKDFTTSAAALRVFPAVGVSCYLDGFMGDLRHLATGRSHFELAQELDGSTGALIVTFNGDGYIMSDKSVNVSPSKQAGCAAEGVAASRGVRTEHKVDGYMFLGDMKVSTLTFSPKERGGLHGPLRIAARSEFPVRSSYYTRSGYFAKFSGNSPWLRALHAPTLEWPWYGGQHSLGHPSRYGCRQQPLSEVAPYPLHGCLAMVFRADLIRRMPVSRWIGLMLNRWRHAEGLCFRNFVSFACSRMLPVLPDSGGCLMRSRTVSSVW